MKIISKYKDYYDFLVGIYGEDEKLILDRTKFYKSPDYSSLHNWKIFRFAICGYRVDGMFLDGKFLYGEDLIPYIFEEKYYFNIKKEKDYYSIKVPGITTETSYRRETSIKVLKKSLKLDDKDNVNIKMNCPILIRTLENYWEKNDTYEPFPILKDYNISKVFTAEEMWIMLSEWLGKEKIIEDKQTDKEKIVSKGFDIKSSFRKM